MSKQSFPSKLAALVVPKGLQQPHTHAVNTKISELASVGLNSAHNLVLSCFHAQTPTKEHLPVLAGMRAAAATGLHQGSWERLELVRETVPPVSDLCHTAMQPPTKSSNSTCSDTIRTRVHLRLLPTTPWFGHITATFMIVCCPPTCTITSTSAPIFSI